MAGGTLFAARKPLPSGELGLTCPCQGRRGQTKDGLSCIGGQVCGEGRVGFNLWLLLVGRLNPFHQKIMDESGRRGEVRMGDGLAQKALRSAGASSVAGLGFRRPGAPWWEAWVVCAKLAGDEGRRRWSSSPGVSPAGPSWRLLLTPARGLEEGRVGEFPRGLETCKESLILSPVEPSFYLSRH